jgi:hypothetical protein
MAKMVYQAKKGGCPMRLNILWGGTLLVLLTTGCSLTYRAGIYPIPPDLRVREFQGQGEPIAIKNGAKDGKVYIGTASPYSYYADLNQLTDVTVSFLGAELSKRGFSLQGDAPKSITLNVIGMDLTYTIGVYHCRAKIEYIRSDGYKQLFFPYNASGLQERACNGTITRGIAELLNDEKFIDFLKSKER